MLGKSLQSLTELHPANARDKARRHKKKNGQLLFVPTYKEIDVLSDQQKAALLLNEAEAIEAIAQAEIQENLEQFNAPDIVDVIESECYAKAEKFRVIQGKADYSALRRPKLTDIQKRILRHIFTYDANKARFRYMTVGYSAPKKSGKTSISGWVGYYYNKYVFPPNVGLLVANDRDQAHGLAFQTMKPSLHADGAKIVDSSYYAQHLNGSVIESITTDSASESGKHYMFTLWTELWAFYLPSKMSLWAEVLPISTEKCSMRWFDSYMGYEDKSPLLLSMFLEIFADTTESVLHPKARPVAELEDIRTTDINGTSIPCCYERPDLDYFFYIDHERRMPWQKDKQFFVSAGIGLTETDVTRLLFNRWQKSENKFLKSEPIRKSFERGKDIPLEPNRKMVLAIDAASGKASATAALAGCFDAWRKMKNPETGEIEDFAIYRTGFAKSWGGGEVDLTRDVMAEVYRLYLANLILEREADASEKKWIEAGCKAIEVHYDPTEMHQVAIDFRKKYQLLLKPFDQKAERERADTFLQVSYQNDRVDNLQQNADRTKDDLFKHIDAASEISTNNKDNSRRVRIVQSGNQPIDLLVAQSMAVWKLQARPPSRRRFGSLATGKAKM